MKTVQQEKAEQVEAEEHAQREQSDFENGMQMIERYIETGHYGVARKRFEMLKRKKPGLIMPEKWLIRMIRGSTTDGVHNKESAALMQQYLAHYQTLKIPVALNLARFLIVEQERPRKGIRYLNSIKNERLDARQVRTFQSLGQHAKKLIADGVIELGD